MRANIHQPKRLHMLSADERADNLSKELMEASSKGNVDGVKQCLNTISKSMEFKENDINIINFTMDKQTALHLACTRIYNQSTEQDTEQDNKLIIVQLLCEQYAANINIKDFYSRTPFHLACFYGMYKIAKFIVNGFNASNIDHLKIKYLAQTTTSFDTMNCGDLNYQEFEITNLSALHLACARSDYPENRQKIVQLLLDNKFNINDTDNLNRTPLYYSCFSKLSLIINYLLVQRADVSIKGFHNLYKKKEMIRMSLYKPLELVEYMYHNNENSDTDKRRLDGIMRLLRRYN